MNTIVVCHPQREPLVRLHIAELNPLYSWGADYPGTPIGTYRCQMGHITALAAYMTDDVAVVFEDDCVPNKNRDWQGAIEEAASIVRSGLSEIVCLHGRGNEEIPAKFQFERHERFEWARPPAAEYTVQGTLAYVVGREGAWKIRQLDPWLWAFHALDTILWSSRFDWMLLKDVEPGDWWANPHFHHGAGAENSLLRNPLNSHFSRAG